MKLFKHNIKSSNVIKKLSPNPLHISDKITLSISQFIQPPKEKFDTGLCYSSRTVKMYSTRRDLQQVKFMRALFDLLPWRRLCLTVNYSSG